MSDIEPVSFHGKVYCYIVRSSYSPTQTTFVTSQDSIQQVGFIVRDKGATIARHVHRTVERRIIGTPEVLLVRTGRCEVDLYSDEQERIATCQLFAGDVILLVAGGHGFRVLEDTVLMEVKQGPYMGQDDKSLF
jgi:hypothetical protein